jgi:hypothetical protein
MTDIVERLLDIEGEWADAEIREEAADEIKRLRKRLYEVDAQLTAEGRIHAGECMELRTEIVLLRAERAEMSRKLDNIGKHPDVTILIKAYARGDLDPRAALEPKP